jgi:hypothetical protein
LRWTIASSTDLFDQAKLWWFSTFAALLRRGRRRVFSWITAWLAEAKRPGELHAEPVLLSLLVFEVEPGEVGDAPVNSGCLSLAIFE